MRDAMIEKMEAVHWRLAAAQPPSYQPCSNYRYFVASEGIEPSPTEPKSVVRPTHREAEPLIFEIVLLGSLEET